jgi:hypothetical protein
MQNKEYYCQTGNPEESERDFGYWFGEGLGVLGTYFDWQKEKESSDLPDPDKESKDEEEKIMGLAKPIFYISLVIAIVIVALAINKFLIN